MNKILIAFAVVIGLGVLANVLLSLGNAGMPIPGFGHSGAYKAFQEFATANWKHDEKAVEYGADDAIRNEIAKHVGANRDFINTVFAANYDLESEEAQGDSVVLKVNARVLMDPVGVESGLGSTICPADWEATMVNQKGEWRVQKYSGGRLDFPKCVEARKGT